MFPRLHERATFHLLQTQILCPGHKKCLILFRNICVSQFAQPKKHHGQQCVRNNVPSFTRAFRSGFKVPASVTPYEIDRESVQKRVWVPEWVEASSQESWNPSSSGNCCFSSGEKFSSGKDNQNEVDEAMPSSSKQNKNIKLWEIPEVTSFVTNPSLRGQLNWAWPKREI